ncbi:MAG: hypothetical protein JXR37_26435 [Kiritimatiellae bacterium]|nr:hypothetical protein [Kiritimatiellia bacterium]
MGLLKPQSGSAEVMGVPAWELGAAEKAKLGYVPQEVKLYDWLSVLDLLRYVGSFYPEWNAEFIARLAKRLRIVSGSPMPADLTVPGLLHREVSGNEALLSVRGLDEKLVRDIEQQWSASVEVRDLSLATPDGASVRALCLPMSR